jgi:hypothetical protein
VWSCVSILSRRRAQCGDGSSSGVAVIWGLDRGTEDVNPADVGGTVPVIPEMGSPEAVEEDD